MQAFQHRNKCVLGSVVPVGWNGAELGGGGTSDFDHGFDFRHGYLGFYTAVVSRS
jgi:hypothetical protein